VPEVDDMETAVALAQRAVAAGAGDRRAAERLTQAGTAALDALRSFTSHPLSMRPPEGAPADPLRERRHDVRAAAQTVLSQLELMAMAWRSWSRDTRGAVLDELDEAAGELTRQVDGCLAAPGQPPI
jgi:hypothetical protein